MTIFGRPMTFLAYAFTDRVTKESVNVYKDNKDRYWLATSRWALFRVLSSKEVVEFHIAIQQMYKEIK